MINDKDIALKISTLMVEIGANINDSISMVKNECSEFEFEAYKKAAGKVMGEMLLEIMNPIYKEHPDIKPKGFA